MQHHIITKGCVGHFPDVGLVYESKSSDQLEKTRELERIRGVLFNAYLLS